MSAEPVVVTVGFAVNSLKKIDAIEGVVDLDFILYVSWKDPALVGIPVSERPPYTEDLRKGDDTRPCCWNPTLEINNDVSLEMMWDKFPDAYQDVATGKVMWGARYRGCVSNRMDLQQFPLDSDRLSIVVGPKEYPEDKCVIEVDSSKHGFPGAPGDRIKDSALEEWSLATPRVIIKRSGPTGSGSYYSNIEFGIVVHRLAWYYSMKLMSIVYMLVMVSWTVMFFPPSNFEGRLNVILVLFLSTIAFLYVAAADLPKVSYLTLLDKLMLSSFIAQFVCGLQSFIVYIIDARRQALVASGTDTRTYCASWFTPSVSCELGVADWLDMVTFVAMPPLFILSQVAYVSVALHKRRIQRQEDEALEAREVQATTEKRKSRVAREGSPSTVIKQVQQVQQSA